MILNVQPAATQPAIDPTTANEIFARTVFGAIKAVIGSKHAFAKKVKQKVVVTNAKGKDGKPLEVEVDKTEVFYREVRSIFQHAHIPQRWLTLDGAIVAESESELLSKIYAVHGGPEQMRKDAKRVIYCAELLSEVDVHTSIAGEPAIVRETCLVSDREPGN